MKYVKINSIISKIGFHPFQIDIEHYIFICNAYANIDCKFAFSENSITYVIVLYNVFYYTYKFLILILLYIPTFNLIIF